MININRIMNNDLTILTSRSNEGKSMVLFNLIKDYKARFKGDIWVFGVKGEL